MSFWSILKDYLIIIILRFIKLKLHKFITKVTHYTTLTTILRIIISDPLKLIIEFLINVTHDLIDWLAPNSLKSICRYFHLVTYRLITNHNYAALPHLSFSTSYLNTKFEVQPKAYNLLACIKAEADWK